MAQIGHPGAPVALRSGRWDGYHGPVKLAGIVPAKGSSTRVPGKNRRLLGGVPLFLWAANNLARAMPRDRVYIDSDDPQTLALASAQGFSTLRRPAELATNATDGNALMLWAASQVRADIYVQNLPPMPFLRGATLHRAIDAVRGGAASALGVRREKVYRWDANGPTYDLAQIPNSFDLPETVMEGMGLYVMRAEALERTKVRAAEPRVLIDLDPFEAIDIDHEIDLEFAQVIAAGLPASSPLVAGIQELRQAIAETATPNRIKLLALDIDGVMTDGGMYVSEGGDELKKFNTKDGMAIKHLVRTGTAVAFVSSSTHRTIIDARARRLEVERVHAGPGKKLEIVDAWRADLGIEWDEIAYVGDDVNDLPVIERVGLSACPADAASVVRATVDVILAREGGRGCVREFVDLHIAPKIEHHE